MSIFRRAFAGQNLTPGERAFLKLVKTVVFTALAFILGGQGLVVLGQVQRPGADVGAILHDNLLTPLLTLILLTVEKWFTAQGDAPLPGLPGSPETPQPAPPAA